MFACGDAHLFPARLKIHLKNGIARRNRFRHISPDTLNLALKRLPLEGVEHFPVHDILTMEIADSIASSPPPLTIN